ncbi:MAG: hypothetical protein EOM24_16280 [Chloroflexia bacterium]|nr:hypothetical protein [Chloroflexia bacterium]
MLWVARHAYLHHARRRSFLLATFGLPLLLVGIMGLVSLVLVNQTRPETALGYVDQSGLLAEFLPQTQPPEQVPLLAFPNQTSAEAAHAAGQIAA